MAEEVLEADVGEKGAPAVPSPAGADHPTPQYVTREDHDASIQWLHDEIKEMVSQGYRGTQQLFDRKVSEMAAKMGMTQAEAAAVLEELATETVGAERTAEARTRAQAKAKAAADAERLADLEAREAAERGKQPERQADPQDQLVQALWGNMKSRMERLAKAEGLEVQPFIDRASKELVSYGPDRRLRIAGERDYATGMDTFEERVRGYIAAAADAQHTAEQGRVEMDTAAANGGSLSGLDSYRKAMREGKPLPSTAEIDRLTAKYR